MDLDRTIPLNIDNKSTISMAKNLVDFGRCKHIAIKYHALRNYVRSKVIEVEYIPSIEQVADPLTKLMYPKQLCYLREKMGLKNSRSIYRNEGNSEPNHQGGVLKDDVIGQSHHSESHEGERMWLGFEEQEGR